MTAKIIKGFTLICNVVSKVKINDELAVETFIVHSHDVINKVLLSGLALILVKFVADNFDTLPWLSCVFP